MKQLSDKATIPIKATKGSAGYDIFNSENVTIQPGCIELVKTDIAITCPPGTYGRIAPRSGLTIKQKLDIRAGVIDSDYTGPILVAMYNIGDQPQSLRAGSRIAQLILEQISNANITTTHTLQETSRGA